MWWFTGLACSDPLPEAFDWKIDRTLVAGIAPRPSLVGAGETPTVDALILSPWAVRSVSVDLCGLVTDRLAFVDARCYSEPALIVPVADQLPSDVPLPALDFDCPSYGTTLPPPPLGPGATSVPTGKDPYRGYATTCASSFPLRVSAVTDEDVGYGIVLIEVSPETLPPFTTLDPAAYDLRIDVVDGQVAAGAEVVLEVSQVNELIDNDGSARWYVDDGDLLSTGRTLFVDQAEERATSRNTLRIPEEWSGPLRVAVVAHSGRVWTVTTLEVPMILGWFACVGADPFRNEAPFLRSFNGLEVPQRKTVVQAEDLPGYGEAYPLVLEVDDPERQAVRVWFPYSQGWVDFNPDGTEGVWYVPEDPVDFALPNLIVVLEDDHDPPARQEYVIDWSDPGGSGR